MTGVRKTRFVGAPIGQFWRAVPAPCERADVPLQALGVIMTLHFRRDGEVMRFHLATYVEGDFPDLKRHVLTEQQLAEIRSDWKLSRKLVRTGRAA